MAKWKVDENKELPVAVTEDGFGICTLDGGGTASREELEKTARLIAATPDFLDACKDFVKGWPHFLDCLDFNHSTFDADSIRWMNEVPGKIQTAINRTIKH